jgi:hypothetical protein
MRFLVDIPDDTVQWANAEGINRQQIAKFMREELHAVASRFGHSPELNRPQIPGQSHEWRGFIFNEARVLVPRSKPLKEPDIDTCKQNRSKTSL